MLGQTLVEVEQGRAERWQSVAGVGLLALTGCRLSESGGLQQVPGSVYVLPAARGGQGPFASLDDALERIMSEAKLAGASAHPLRHSFASTAGDLGYSDSTIGAMLGHAGLG